MTAFVDGIDVGSTAFQERTALILRFNALAAAHQTFDSSRFPYPVATEINRELHVVGNMLWPNALWSPYEKPK